MQDIQLTDEQINTLENIYLPRWKEIGLSTEPADREKAEIYIRKAYKSIGCHNLQRIIWSGSPYSNALMNEIATYKGKNLDHLIDKIEELGIIKYKEILKMIENELGKDQLNQLKANIKESVWESIYGCHDYYWLMAYDFFTKELEIPNKDPKIDILIEMSKECGWIIPYENVCFVSDKPIILSFDEHGFLHSLTGPAIAYNDGYKIYAIHGEKVKKWVGYKL